MLVGDIRFFLPETTTATTRQVLPLVSRWAQSHTGEGLGSLSEDSGAAVA